MLTKEKVQNFLKEIEVDDLVNNLQIMGTEVYIDMTAHSPAMHEKKKLEAAMKQNRRRCPHAGGHRGTAARHHQPGRQRARLGGGGRACSPAPAVVPAAGRQPQQQQQEHGFRGMAGRCRSAGTP